jgi:hypothetical protein
LRREGAIVGGMNEHDLALLPPAVQAYIRQLEAHAAQASAQID